MSFKARTGARVEDDLHMLGREKSSGAGDSQSVLLVSIVVPCNYPRWPAAGALPVPGLVQQAERGIPLAQYQSRDGQREYTGSERQAILETMRVRELRSGS